MTCQFDTTQSVAAGGPAARRFWKTLLIGGCHDWRGADVGGTIVLSRRVSRGFGEPDVQVDVETGIQVAIPPAYREASTARSFADAEEVVLPAVRGVRLDASDVRALAALVLRHRVGLRVQRGAGSTSSSNIGLAFAHVDAHLDDGPAVQIGGTTLAAHGRTIVSGAVSLG